MPADIHKLIAAINPEIYCQEVNEESGEHIRSKVKKFLKENPQEYLKAAEMAKPIEYDYMDARHVQAFRNAFALDGIKNPIEKHELVYDDYSQNLEPVYFWLLDYINREYGKTEKLVDNFVGAAGSAHFSEMSQRAKIMQDEAMKMLGSVNQVVKSVLNIIYDLKEFKIRLKQYEDYHSKSPDIKNAALLGLKQIWLDQVDAAKRGTSSIKALAASGANQPNFVTLIDAFMASKSLEELNNLDLNDRVKRLLQQRVAEFIRWIEVSEQELTKRFNIEKNYLKSQYNTIKLYSRWIKPYLLAARKLEQRDDRFSDTSALVTAFNTALFELTVLGQDSYSPKGDIAEGNLPESFKKIKTRKYSPIVIIEFNFRSSPERADQRGGYGFRGRAQITFTSYALNEDEIKILKEQVEKDDIGSVLKVIEGATDESLTELQKDIDEFLEDKPQSLEKENKVTTEDTNPFTALFSFLKRDKKNIGSKIKAVIKDTYEEKVIRNLAIIDARWKCRKAYNDYKKARGMQAFSPIIH